MKRILLPLMCFVAIVTLCMQCTLDDTTPPRITVLYPQHMDTIYLGPVELAAKVFDESGVEEVKFGAAGMTMTPHRCLPDTYWVIWNTMGLRVDSSYRVGIFASDIHENEATDSITLFLAAKKAGQ